MSTQRIDELTKLIEEIGRPNALKAILARRPFTPKIWEKENPEKAEKYWKLFGEREELYAKADAEYAGVSKMTPRQAGIPEFALNGHKAIQETSSLLAARSVLSDALKPLLALAGRPGCGKTVAASIVCDEFVKTGGIAQFVRATEVGKLGIFGEDGARAEQLREVGLLVIDDLGTEVMSVTWGHNFQDMLDYRYQNQLKTILTTNLTPEQFTARYGERAMRRITQCGRYFVATAHKQDTRSP